MFAKGLRDLKNVLKICLIPKDRLTNLNIRAILRDLITVVEDPIFKSENYSYITVIIEIVMTTPSKTFHLFEK